MFIIQTIATKCCYLFIQIDLRKKTYYFFDGTKCISLAKQNTSMYYLKLITAT